MFAAGAACRRRRLPPTTVNSVQISCSGPVGGVAAAGQCPPRLPPPDRQRPWALGEAKGIGITAFSIRWAPLGEH